MKGTFVSLNELKFLKDVLDEIIEYGESNDKEDARDMVLGFIEEQGTIESAEFDKYLDENIIKLEKDEA